MRRHWQEPVFIDFRSCPRKAFRRVSKDEVLTIDDHFTSIRLGFASSALGKTRVITPSRISALILS